MQYVRSLGGSVSKTWNSINPATLSGAIDVIVVEQEDGKHTLPSSCACARPNSSQARLLVHPSMYDLASSRYFDPTRKRYATHALLYVPC